MTEQHTTNAPIGPVDHANSRRFRLLRPRWYIIAGIVIGASFTGGYLINSYFFCLAQTNCGLPAHWIIAIALLGASVGALFGWTSGKFFRFFYRLTRVD